ncbi:MAG TPA: hypothetical protein VIL43_01850 [Burkholderiales bacterium]
MSRNGHVLRRSIWCLIVFAAILYAPSKIVFGEPFWRLPGSNAWIEGGFAAVFLISAGLPALVGHSKRLLMISCASTGAASHDLYQRAPQGAPDELVALVKRRLGTR